MNINTFGANFFLGQLPRINETFLALGHTLDYNSAPDLIYSNDPGGYDEAIWKKKQFPEAKLILNVLDIPIHLLPNNFNLNTLKEKLLHADHVTAISSVTQKHIKEYLDLNSFIILNPKKPVSFCPWIKKLDLFLYVGRANDPNKRFSLIFNFFRKYNLSEKRLVVVGPENPGVGQYQGVINDDQLNEYYNACKWLLFPSKHEGLGLPMVEALCCQCVPILANDNECARAYAPEFTAPDADYASFAATVVNEYSKYRTLTVPYSDEYTSLFSQQAVANRILNLIKCQTLE